MDILSQMFTLPPETARKLVHSAVLLALLWLLRWLASSIARRKIRDEVRLYYWRRSLVTTQSVLTILLVGRIWIRGIDSLATFLGLFGAGLAIAMHEVLANVAGWLFIVWRKPFKVGDRIQVGQTSGDVIDVRLFQFSMIEIGNWVDAEQSTGRIVHVPNSKVLREILANYETGFEYIWNELPVLITFESNLPKARTILEAVLREHTERLSPDVKEQIRRAGRKYLIRFRHLTPIVYTAVKESGVALTLRYIVKPRERRGSESAIWEAVLSAFGREEDIDLAYPTTRFYRRGEAESADRV